MRSSIIYGLHAGDGVIRYVGKTVRDVAGRLRTHRSHAKACSALPVHRWLRKHSPHVVGVVLEEVPADGDWSVIEQAWIKALRSSNGLLNILNGGEGAHEVVFTPERRAKISAALKRGKWVPCVECGTPRWTIPSQEKRGHGLLCSRACRSAVDRRKPPPPNRFTPQALAAAAAKRKAITHCPQGHAYEGANLRETPTGRRVCRACARAATAKNRRNRLDRIVNSA